MKTIKRILIITAAFYTFAGLMIVGVNFLRTASVFDGPGEDRPSTVVLNTGGDAKNQPRPPERNEGDRNPSFSSLRWLQGMIKNTGIIGMLVVLIVLPKSMFKKKKRKVVAPL